MPELQPEETRAIEEGSMTEKQMSFLPNDDAPQKYTVANGSPLYVPKERRPHVIELCNMERTGKLLKEIEESTVSAEEKRFLTLAAYRHAVFNYELIADYYSHATPEMQRLVENSALVIVDFDRAIELGYVELCDAIKNQYMVEQVGNGN